MSRCVILQIEMLDGGFDVLVATPGRLLAHHERGSLNLSNTAALVMDEVDVLAGVTPLLFFFGGGGIVTSGYFHR
jgi:hypothetical protein